MSFYAQIVIDSERFFQVAEDVLDNRKVTELDWQRMREFIDILNSLTSGQTDEIAPILDQVEQLNAMLKQKVKGSHAITNRDLYNLLYSNYLSVTPVVK